MRNKFEYQIIKQVENMDDSSFIKFENGRYKYKNWIIDYQYDEPLYEDSITDEDDFEPFMCEGYTRVLISNENEKYDYVPNVCYVNFKKDIEKYKDLIIKCIDNYISND